MKIRDLVNDTDVKRALAQERKDMADVYRAMRREGHGRAARELRKQIICIAQALTDALMNQNHATFTKH